MTLTLKMLYLFLFMVTDAVLSEITDLASCLLEPREVAHILNLNISDFEYQVKQCPEGVIGRAFHCGRLKTKVEVRRKIIALAKAGSPQAEMLADKYLIKDI